MLDRQQDDRVTVIDDRFNPVGESVAPVGHDEGAGSPAEEDVFADEAAEDEDKEAEAPDELIRLSEAAHQALYGARSVGVSGKRYEEMQKGVDRIATRSRHVSAVKNGYSALAHTNPVPTSRIALEHCVYDLSRLIGRLSSASSALFPETKGPWSEIREGEPSGSLKGDDRGETVKREIEARKAAIGDEDARKAATEVAEKSLRTWRDEDGTLREGGPDGPVIGYEETREQARQRFAKEVLARKVSIDPARFPRGPLPGMVPVVDPVAAFREYQRLPKAWQESLALAVAGLPLAGSPDAEAVCGVLEEEFPWMREANRHVRESLCIRSLGGVSYFWMPPLLIDGPPGVGKSRWAKRLGELVGVPCHEVSCAGVNDGFSIVGNHRSYHNAEAGLIYKKVMDAGVSNPLMVFDELDKTSTGTHNGRLVDSLLTVLEPATAERVMDNFLQVPVDMSHIVWVFCSNSLAGIPEPLLSRLTVVKAEEPEREDAEKAFAAVVAGVAEDFGVATEAMPEIGDDAKEALLDEFEGHRSLRILKSRVRRHIGEAISPSAPRKAKDLKRVALHEAGHALMAGLSGRTVLKASVVPDDLARGAAGFVLSVPSDRDAMETAESLKGRVALALGGYAAEKAFFGTSRVSHGSSSDIEVATETCRRIVRLGLSDLGVRVAGKDSKEVDAEAQKILDESMMEAEEAVARNRHVVETFAERLEAAGSMGRHEAAEVLSHAKRRKKGWFRLPYVSL